MEKKRRRGKEKLRSIRWAMMDHMQKLVSSRHKKGEVFVREKRTWLKTTFLTNNCKGRS